MSADLEARVEELLRQSLAAWGVGGEVSRSADGALLVAAAGRELRVTRAQGDMPFRWMVADGGFDGSQIGSHDCFRVGIGNLPFRWQWLWIHEALTLTVGLSATVQQRW